jgi:quercetin dioxygenase-like cupin family protein
VPGRSRAGSLQPERRSARLCTSAANSPNPDRRQAWNNDPKQPTTKGPAEYFTGDVWIDPVTQGEPPSKLNIGAVHFSPGARTAWHSHDGGQTLYVTEGRGLVQSRGGQTVEIRSGDVIYTPNGEEHWHGATP